MHRQISIRINNWVKITVPVAVLGLGACGDRQGDGTMTPAEGAQPGGYQEEQFDQGMPEQRREQGPQGQQMEGGEQPMGQPGQQPQAMMQQGEVLAVVYAINRGEMDLATMARTKSQSTDVKELADHILSDHRKSLQNFEDIAKEQNISAESGKMTTKLQNKTTQVSDRLRELTGEEFDREFVRANIEMHQEVMQKIDDKLIPATRSPELQSQLRDLRNMVATHLEHAREVQSKLMREARRQ